MDNSWQTYPISTIISALSSLWGRLFLFFLSCGLGASLGQLVVDFSLVGAILAFTIAPFIQMVTFPLLLISSIILGYGLIAIPLLAGSVYFYVIKELRFLFLLFPMFVAFGVSLDMSLTIKKREEKRQEWLENILQD